MITTHSLRAYAISKLNKVDTFGFGGALAGQKFYLSQYNRWEEGEEKEGELLNLYIKAEPELWIYQSKPESKDMVALQKQINDLRDELADVQDQYVEDTKPVYYSKIDIENQRKGLY